MMLGGAPHDLVIWQGMKEEGKMRHPSSILISHHSLSPTGELVCYVPEYSKGNHAKPSNATPCGKRHILRRSRKLLA
jgi:hypothetical protein